MSEAAVERIRATVPAHSLGISTALGRNALGDVRAQDAVQRATD